MKEYEERYITKQNGKYIIRYNNISYGCFEEIEEAKLNKRYLEIIGWDYETYINEIELLSYEYINHLEQNLIKQNDAIDNERYLWKKCKDDPKHIIYKWYKEHKPTTTKRKKKKHNHLYNIMSYCINIQLRDYTKNDFYYYMYMNRDNLKYHRNSFWYNDYLENVSYHREQKKEIENYIHNMDSVDIIVYKLIRETSDKRTKLYHTLDNIRYTNYYKFQVYKKNNTYGTFNKLSEAIEFKKYCINNDWDLKRIDKSKWLQDYKKKHE